MFLKLCKIHSPFQIINQSGFSRYIALSMYLDINVYNIFRYIAKAIYVPRKVRTTYLKRREYICRFVLENT
jgi:hypothetical protein